MIQIRFISVRIFLIGIRVSPNETDEIDMWVEFKCPICGRDLGDDKSMANFMV